MSENTKGDAASTKSSGMKPVVVLIIGGVVILFVVGLAIQFFVKKAGTSLLSGVIENKTGVKTNLGDIEKGKVTFTDTKTGQTVNIGGEKLPDTFPKDFPIYPGAKVVAAVSNAQQGKGNGFLVTFTAPDGHGLDKVVPFYKNGLITSGWTIISSFDSDIMQSWVIAKGTTEGSVSITTSARDPLTIVVTLGEKE
jgi:hypothetical protein